MRYLDTFEQDNNNQRSSQSSEVDEIDYKNITLTYLIEEKFLPRALRSGIALNDFYDYTLKDIKLIIDAYDDNELDRLKMEAQMNYANAICLTSFIATLMSKDAKAPKFEDVYAFLYNAEELAEIEQQKEEAKRQAELKKQQASWVAFANAFNAKREQNENNIDGR